MSVIAAMIASFTALFIAVVIYPWQKQIDRSNDLAREMRALHWKILHLLGSTKNLYEMILTNENELDKLLIGAVALGDLEAAQKLDELKVVLSGWHERRDKLRSGGVEFLKQLLSKNREIPMEAVQRLSDLVADLLALANRRITDNRIVSISLREWLSDYLGRSK